MDPESGLNIPAEEVLLEDDLLDFNKGSDAEQTEKQQRVVQSVLSLGPNHNHNLKSNHACS